MNILVYGKVASGKTFIATALKHYYESHGQHCDLLEDDTLGNPIGRYFLAGRKATIRFLRKTLHKTDKHFIMTTQIVPAEILRPDTEDDKDLFDYVYCTERI